MVLGELMAKLQAYSDVYGDLIEIRVVIGGDDSTYEIESLESPIIDTDPNVLFGHEPIVSYEEDPHSEYPSSYRKVVTLHYETRFTGIKNS